MRSIGLALLVLGVGGCGGSPDTTTALTVGTPQIAIVSGNGQSAAAGTRLAAPLVTQVTTASGPVTGATVRWTATSGSLSPSVTPTDAAGRAQTEWTLGAAGPATTVAAVDGGGSVNFSATATGGSTGGASHEPAGYARLTERSFGSMNEAGWKAESVSSVSIVSDATAPRSAPQVLQVTYPAGFKAGASPGDFEFYSGGAGATRNYISVWLKLSDNFEGQSSGTNKLIFDWINDNPEVFVSAEGTGSGTLRPTLRLQGTADRREYLYPNVVAGAQFRRGQWHRLELLLVANTPGTANGSAQWWLDDVLIGDYRDIQYAGSGQKNVWQYLMVAPIWGGIGGAVSQTMNIRFDHIYLSAPD